jgi:hypothetical protein
MPVLHKGVLQAGRQMTKNSTSSRRNTWPTGITARVLDRFGPGQRCDSIDTNWLVQRKSLAAESITI